MIVVIKSIENEDFIFTSNFLMINRVLRFWKSYDGLMAFVAQLAKRQTNLGGNRVEDSSVVHADIKHQ